MIRKLAGQKQKTSSIAFVFLLREPLKYQYKGLPYCIPYGKLRPENLNVCTICRVRAHITSFSCVEITPPYESNHHRSRDRDMPLSPLHRVYV